jgi:peptide/nickel transport system permease protein
VLFLSVHLTGDPAAYLLGPELGNLEYEQLKKNLGLDRLLIAQYGDFLLDIVRADFGKSPIMGRPAREVLFERLPATLELAAAAFVLSIVVGVPLGILSAVKRNAL